MKNDLLEKQIQMQLELDAWKAEDRDRKEPDDFMVNEHGYLGYEKGEE